MVTVDCIKPIMIGMHARRDMIGLACEALAKMFDASEEGLVQQVMMIETPLFVSSISR